MNNKVYIFLPLYNLEPTQDIINKSFNGWKIIDRETYFSRYKKHFRKINQSFGYSMELDNILRAPQAGMLHTHPITRYTLVKNLKLLPYINQKNADTNQKCINTALSEIRMFVIGARLLQAGNLQINKYYILANSIYETSNLDISTTMDAIDNFIYRGSVFLENYKLNRITLNKISKFRKNFVSTTQKLFIPINYFCEYYSAKNIYDKTLKLITALECILLGDKCSELKYTLQVRACTFLNRNVSETLKLAYDVRSKICHTGTVSKDELKKIKKLISDSSEKSNFDYILLFLRDYLEGIVRDILMKAITLMKRKNIKIKDITKAIDDVLLKKGKSI